MVENSLWFLLEKPQISLVGSSFRATQDLRISPVKNLQILNAMGLSLKISAIFLLVPSYSLLYSFELPNNETFSKWNRMLELKLSDLANDVTQADYARTVYKSDPAVTLEKINGEQILNSVFVKIRKFLEDKKLALKSLVDSAEENFSKFQNFSGSMLTVEDLSFLNMKALKPEDKLTFDPRFRQKVSFKESGVHIPLEIFDGYVDILNGLKWTGGLEEVFKRNRRIDSTLRWQYFGSYYGFMRVYPAFRWPDHPSLPDLFDVRRRSWYIQGSVTPKDVIILIDRSGSVHGPTLDIMKITARALLNSLGENDFVNVAWFNNRVRWVVPCLKTLVQATAQIKRLLGDAVEQLTESNRTSYATALDFAFEAFKKFDDTKKPWAGSNCHKIIMFLSDGGTEWPSDLITKHCNESRNGRIKIFTFACGPHPIPTVVLKEMACATGGYFSPITALGSVRVKIQDYVKVLSRPLAYSEDTDMYHWHTTYRDVGGLGTVTAVTLPVFNRNYKNSNFTHLLGVMGIDIPVKEMAELFPKHLLGPFGYSFAINTNGFVLFHPRLHDRIVYIEDPPNIYLTDLEGTTEEVTQMEKKMIDGFQGSLHNYQSIVPVGLGHAIVVNMDYFYGSVDSSTFRFGLAIPSNQTIIKVEISDIIKSASFLLTMSGIILAPWAFCTGDGDEDLTAEKLYEKILYNYTNCDESLINKLLWNLEKINLIKNQWSLTSIPEIRSRFVITSSGLTVHSSKVDHGYKNQADPYKNNLFKRASKASGFIFSPEKRSWGTATVARRVMLEGSTVAAVIGAEIEQEMIQNVFEEVTMGQNQCQFSELLHCYLLNDGGIIVASNHKISKAGEFIGLHDPELLKALLLGNILKREYRYNYQSPCSKNTQYVQATATTYQSSILIFLYEVVVSFQWNFIYSTILYFLSGVSAWKRGENVDSILESGNQSCVTKSAWYYHSGLANHSGIINCEVHSRNFQTTFLPNVSLIFLVAQPQCKGLHNYIPISLASEEDLQPKHCSEGQHYRLRPTKCYSKIPKDILSDCGGTSTGHATTSKVSVLVAETSFIFFLLML